MSDKSPIDTAALRKRHTPPTTCPTCGDPVTHQFTCGDGAVYSCKPRGSATTSCPPFYVDVSDPDVPPLCDEVDRLRAEVHRLSLIHDREQQVVAPPRPSKYTKVQAGDYVHATLRDEVARYLCRGLWVCRLCGLVHAANEPWTMMVIGEPGGITGRVCRDQRCPPRPGKGD